MSVGSVNEIVCAGGAAYGHRFVDGRGGLVTRSLRAGRCASVSPPTVSYGYGSFFFCPLRTLN